MSISDSDWKKDWLNFLKGKWVQDMPLQEGTYFLADNEGRQCGNKGIVYIDSKPPHSCKSVESWGGYWWSVPIPKLPNLR